MRSFPAFQRVCRAAVVGSRASCDRAASGSVVRRGDRNDASW